MGILDFLFKKKHTITLSFEDGSSDNRASLPEFKDERKAECPSCHGKLKKAPGAKTKCPHCGEYMYVRTNPQNVRLVVTEEGAEKIDEEWRIENGTQDQYLAQQDRKEDRKNTLKERFGGKNLSDHDVQWSLFNEDLLGHMKNQDWGLYRNTKFDMAELLRKEDRLESALNMYLEVCYLDLNGPNNRGGFSDQEILKEFPAFDPGDGNAFLAPGVIDRIMKIAKKLGIPMSDLSDRFIGFNIRFQESMKLPVSAREAWKIFENEIAKNETEAINSRSRTH